MWAVAEVVLNWTIKAQVCPSSLIALPSGPAPADRKTQSNNNNNNNNNNKLRGRHKRNNHESSFKSTKSTLQIMFQK